MKLDQIRTIAKSHGIHPGKLTKGALIHAIQTEEGNFACFSTANRNECHQEACLWRADCTDSSRHTD